MHSQDELLGNVIKEAREKAKLTIEVLAENVGVSVRYIYRIENEGKKPSFDVLYKLIRELSIPPELIFYPKEPSKNSEIENLLRMLSVCDERSLEIVKATTTALINISNKN